ncbi:RNA-binding domain-containing protein [Methanolapillus ohkumae]|uniref:Exosome subunit n=1 Tax=Methanolapillus ohkumae TaxID=3028298 RepID=A0AA96V6R3_9EURY|nr:hypothetical protein MsAm2_06560 [Methanosarcinaceae archaeon Am2]
MIHHINFRVISHATEELSGVRKALDFFLTPCLSPKDNLSELVETVSGEGHFGNPITILTAELKKNSSCMKFSKFFQEHLTDGDRELLRSQMPERLDDDLNFYMRFSKQDAALGQLRLTESSDAIFVKVKIETYPKCWEKAGLIVEELFG